jgi:hypothetical protein
MAIVVAESVNGTIRQLFVAPLLGDLAACQVAIAVGCTLIFVVSVGSTA